MLLGEKELLNLLAVGDTTNAYSFHQFLSVFFFQKHLATAQGMCDVCAIRYSCTVWCRRGLRRRTVQTNVSGTQDSESIIDTYLPTPLAHKDVYQRLCWWFPNTITSWFTSCKCWLSFRFSLPILQHQAVSSCQLVIKPSRRIRHIQHSSPDLECFPSYWSWHETHERNVFWSWRVYTWVQPVGRDGQTLAGWEVFFCASVNMEKYEDLYLFANGFSIEVWTALIFINEHKVFLHWSLDRFLYFSKDFLTDMMIWQVFWCFWYRMFSLRWTQDWGYSEVPWYGVWGQGRFLLRP